MKQKTSVNAALLKRALTNLNMVVPRSPTLPVLRYVDIACHGSTMTMTASDTYAWLSVELPLDAPINAHALVEATKLGGAVSTIDGDSISLTFDDSPRRLIVSSGRSQFRLASTVDNMTFPGLIKESGTLNEFSVKGPSLANALRKVENAMAQNDVRYYLNGIAIQSDGAGINLIATNGHWLAKSHVDLGQALASPVSSIVGCHYVSLLQRLAEADSVTFQIGGKIVVQAGPYLCQIPCVEGKFPEWQRVVPSDPPNTLTVDKQALLTTLNRSSFYWNEKQKGIRLKAEPGSSELIVTTEHDGNQLEDVIEAENDGLDVGLNAVYLKGAVSVIESSEVVMRSSDGTASVLFKDKSDPEWLAVIMPMRM